MISPTAVQHTPSWPSRVVTYTRSWASTSALAIWLPRSTAIWSTGAERLTGPRPTEARFTLVSDTDSLPPTASAGPATMPSSSATVAAATARVVRRSTRFGMTRGTDGSPLDLMVMDSPAGQPYRAPPPGPMAKKDPLPAGTIRQAVDDLEIAACLDRPGVWLGLAPCLGRLASRTVRIGGQLADGGCQRLRVAAGDV